ncbi:unnamed protein product, partial [marine sediment metagenome]
SNKAYEYEIESANVLNQIDPEYVGALTLMTPPGTQIYEMVESKDFIPMEPMDILTELKTLIEHLELTNCVFRTNHASNYLPIKGTLNQDKTRLLEILTETIETGATENLRPSFMRGL